MPRRYGRGIRTWSSPRSGRRRTPPSEQSTSPQPFFRWAYPIPEPDRRGCVHAVAPIFTASKRAAAAAAADRRLRGEPEPIRRGSPGRHSPSTSRRRAGSGSLLPGATADRASVDVQALLRHRRRRLAPTKSAHRDLQPRLGRRRVAARRAREGRPGQGGRWRNAVHRGVLTDARRDDPELQRRAQRALSTAPASTSSNACSKGIGGIVNTANGAIDFWSDPWGNTFKALQASARDLSTTVLPAVTKATLPDLNAVWFLGLTR